MEVGVIERSSAHTPAAGWDNPRSFGCAFAPLRLCVESFLHLFAFRAGTGGLHPAEN
jgi:hypothetical protein